MKGSPTTATPSCSVPVDSVYRALGGDGASMEMSVRDRDRARVDARVHDQCWRVAVSSLPRDVPSFQ